MTLPRLYALNLYWEDWPPTHMLMAMQAQYKGGSKKVKKDSDMSEMLAELAAEGFQIKR